MASFLARVLRRIGRAAEPLVDPDASDRRIRDGAAVKRLEQMTTAASRLAEQVQRVTDRVDKIDRRQVTHLKTAVSTLEWATRRQEVFAQKVLESSEHYRAHELVRERVLARIQRVARRGGPILVGPWAGEVGFELLYWAPFVRWAVEKFRINPDRITLLSRGGTASWYGIDGAHYLDVLETCSPDEFRQRTLKERKQRTLQLFDRQLIRQALRGMGGRASLLHPAMMYGLYTPYWLQQTSPRWVRQFATFARVQPPLIPGLQLPREYVALRFYFSKCFPETPDNQALVTSIVQSLTTDTHVVLLGSGVALDEHRDVRAERSDRVHTVDHLMRPETNLAVQTAVIAGARAFIGTYGGFSYLAPLCGVNTIALYSRRNFYPHHLDFAQHIFSLVSGGSLTVMDAATFPLMRLLAAAAPQTLE